ncbi:MAG: GPR endopeptidase [Clostridia bacterium]|nr:GPR endopeptidase [Clostridia bacterium]
MSRDFCGFEEVFEGSKLIKSVFSMPSFSGSTSLVRHKKGDGEVCVINFSDRVLYDCNIEQEVVTTLTRSLKRMLNKYKVGKRDLVLVVGIGNEGLTADALGASSLEHLEVTEHFYNGVRCKRGYGRLAGFPAGVAGVTGLSSFKVIKSIVEEVKPSLIIAVDTLCCKEVARLNRTIQLSNLGLTPGAGVGNAQVSLNNATLGIPVIAIGAPLVIYARDLVGELNLLKEDLNNVLVTSKEIDIIVKRLGLIIAKSINLAVHGH